MRNQLRKINLELRSQSQSNSFNQEDDGGLERRLRCPELLDQNKYFIQIIPDVLLHNLDQEPKLTKEEVSECVVRGSYDCKNQSEVSMMMS